MGASDLWKDFKYTDVHASLSGGTANTTFLISGGYTRSNFAYPGNYADQRLTLHSALHHSTLDNHLTIDFGVDFSYDQNNSTSFGGNKDVVAPPNLPDLRNSAGNLIWNYKSIDLENYQFYSYLKQKVNTEYYNLNNTLQITYRLLPGLSVSANLGYSRNTNSEHSETPSTAQNPAYVYTSADFTVNNFQTLNIEPQLDYNTIVGKGVFTALLGGSYKKNTSYTNDLRGSGYANDNFMGSINGASSIYAYDTYSIYKYSAGFARVKYVYDQKYIINFTGRRDGSSNFGPGNQFGNFGSVGLGWIFSEEMPFKTSVPVISFGKLSGSYGTSGSDGIAPYQYQAFWHPIYYVPSFQGTQPNAPANLYNPNYSWALKKSLNLSLDLGFFRDRLLVNGTFYRDRESNQLAAYPLPAQVGFPSVFENLNSTVQNQGWEFALSSTNIKTQAFSWTTNFNLTLNRNKLVSFPNLENSSYARQYMVGKPVSMILGYRSNGLNSQTGLFEVLGNDGHVTNTPVYALPSQGGDLVPIADREVKYMGGFTNNFKFHQFSLYVFFQFSSQNAPNWISTLYSSYPPGLMNNIPVQALDYWKKPGDKTLLQRLASSYYVNTANTGNILSSNAAYSVNTYMRLKTLAISYALPEAALKKMHMRDCSIYVNAQNVLTFGGDKVSDPEQFGDFTGFSYPTNNTSWFIYKSLIRQHMKKILTLHISFTVVLLAAVFVSCKKLIEIPPNPPTAITEAQQFSDSATVMGAVAAVYSYPSNGEAGFSFNNGLISVATGLSSDELIATTSDMNYQTFYTLGLTAVNTTVRPLWSDPYRGLYPVNAIIKNMTDNPVFSASFRTQIVAEMKVVRALYYFHLINLFGPVPYVSSTDYSVTSHLGRSPVDSIYKQILKDLTDARQDLTADYVGNGHYRPNLFAVSAMLAKVFQYQSKWQEAYDAANVVTSSGVYSLEPDLNNVFLDGSTEAIWQIPASGTYNKTQEASNFIPYDPSATPSYLLSSFLLNAFEPGDQRLQQWAKQTVLDNGTTTDTVYSPFKYKYIRQDDPNNEDFMILRLSDIQLIHAEAAANLGNTQIALVDMNQVRARAGLPASDAVSQSDVLDAILHERQTELFCEWGNRWYDLKRTGKDATILAAEKPSWKPTAALYPVPQGELQTNAQLTQNPGY